MALFRRNEKAEKKDWIVASTSKLNRNIAILIAFIVVACFAIRFTPLIRVYAINVVTEAIVNNAINLILLAALLMGLHIVRKRQFMENNGLQEGNEHE